MNHTSFGKVPPEAMQAALEAPAGEAARILRKFEPTFGLCTEEGELKKYRVEVSRRIRATLTAYVDVEATSEDNAEEIVKKMELDTEYFHIKWFLKGTGHVTFKRPELVQQCNRILAKHYPNALPAA